MRYAIGDRFVLDGVECEVGFINGKGYAYVLPLHDGDFYGSYKTLKGLVFAILDQKGKDKFGHKALSMIKQDCGAI